MDGPLGLVDEALSASRTFERADLRDRLEAARARFLDPSLRVVIVGEFKQGKSQLVNALVNATICPVDDDIATAVPTMVMHGADTTATLVYSTDAADGADPVIERFAVSVESLRAAVSERGNPRNEQRLLQAEITLPRDVLANGLCLVDTPGIGGALAGHSAATLAALPSAHAVILVSDCAQEYSKPELDFLHDAAKLCPTVACVMTKTDLYPAWRQVVDLNKGHLRTARFGVQVMPVSSTLRVQALARSDRELNSESGFPELIRFLRNDVVGRAETLARRAVANDVSSVAEHLVMTLTTELAALQAPLGSASMVSELEDARVQADNLRKRSARWQQTLNDGMADLQSDIEYDIRDQMRRLTREAEDYLDDVDPGENWEEFQDWLTERITSIVSTNFIWSFERSQWLANEVAQHFSEEAAAGMPELRDVDTTKVFAPVPEMLTVEDGQISFGQKLLTGMKGSYSGTLMTGLVTSVVTGMALVNPISLSVGVVLGGKAYRDDKKARLKRRQGDAKNIVRRHLDDVVFQISKSSRDQLRGAQRTLRDHFADRADEMHRSLLDSVKVAQLADKRSAVDRERRIREVKPQLEALSALKSRAAQMASTGPITARAAQAKPA